jgi:hypothetical protein
MGSWSVKVAGWAWLVGWVVARWRSVAVLAKWLLAIPKSVMGEWVFGLVSVSLFGSVMGWKLALAWMWWKVLAWS